MATLTKTDIVRIARFFGAHLPASMWGRALKRLFQDTAPVFNTVRSKRWVSQLRAHPSTKQTLERRPLVSVILPTRDRARQVLTAIESVLAQTYPHFELLVIDDGSKDNSVEVISQRFSDPRIKILHTPGEGVCVARNRGLQAAAGEFIAYLDSDNTWRTNYLELMLFDLERSRADCGYAVLHCINRTPAFYRQKRFNFSDLLTDNFIDLNVFMHRSELLKTRGYFDTSLKRMVDWDFIIRCASDSSVSFAYFIGATYDGGPAEDRITNTERLYFIEVVIKNHVIDWPKIREACQLREPDLVSIIMCVYGQPHLTDQCLMSLFQHQAGERFEVVLVDNGSDTATKKVLRRWAGKKRNIRLIENPFNFNFALGNNIGFASSRGSRVVFLNNDTEVTPEWLRSLVRPLASPSIFGAQPKLLYPDGTIQCVGVVFSDRSPLGYPIHVHQPGDCPATQTSRNYSAVTAACLAMRAKDVAKMGGFDPLFTNGQEDIDLCLRLGGGDKVFRYVADSVVFHHEGKSAGRGRYIESNRKLFCQRWSARISSTDSDYYDLDGAQALNYTPDNPAWAELGYAVWRPSAVQLPYSSAPYTASSRLREHTIAIKIGCPKAELKDHWGDYHFAVALAAAFARKGIRSRIDFLNRWRLDATTNDIALVLRGLSRFEPSREKVSLLWMISHPDKVEPRELNRFSHVFVASEIWAKHLKSVVSVPVSPLLQCTDACRFSPDNFDERYATNNLFVANSRKVLRPIVKDAQAQGLTIDIFGEMWDGLAPAAWVKAEKIDNVDLPKYYSSAGVVLNDHWESMRTNGFVSNRIFDAVASGAAVVTDRVEGIPSDIIQACSFFDSSTPLAEAIARARRDKDERPNMYKELAREVQRYHSFDARALEILKTLEGLLGSKS